MDMENPDALFTVADLDEALKAGELGGCFMGVSLAIIVVSVLILFGVLNAGS